MKLRLVVSLFVVLVAQAALAQSAVERWRYGREPVATWKRYLETQHGILQGPVLDPYRIGGFYGIYPGYCGVVDRSLRWGARPSVYSSRCGAVGVRRLAETCLPSR
jgi:post-segregation antitoxin (ccd killing protein)